MVALALAIKQHPITSPDIDVALRRWLFATEPELIRLLYQTTSSQVGALTFQDLTSAVQNGTLTVATLRDWQEQYSEFVMRRMVPLWRAGSVSALEAMGQLNRMMVNQWGVGLDFPQTALRMERWIDKNSAKLITNLTDTQRGAVDAESMRTTPCMLRLLRWLERS